MRVGLMSGTSHDATVTGPAPVAFDTGPDNALTVAAVAFTTNGAEHVDRDGQRAAREKIDEALLKTLLAEPYYRAAPPEKTGKGLFNWEYLEPMFKNTPTPTGDIVTTVTALTARTIAAALAAFEPTEVIASGGGTRNPTLQGMLRAQCGPVPVPTCDQLGLPSAAKEAAAFAVLGFLTVHGIPGQSGCLYRRDTGDGARFDHPRGTAAGGVGKYWCVPARAAVCAERTTTTTQGGAP